VRLLADQTAHDRFRGAQRSTPAARTLPASPTRSRDATWRADESARAACAPGRSRLGSQVGISAQRQPAPGPPRGSPRFVGEQVRALDLSNLFLIAKSGAGDLHLRGRGIRRLWRRRGRLCPYGAGDRSLLGAAYRGVAGGAEAVAVSWPAVRE
jgi:hypothetical protein